MGVLRLSLLVVAGCLTALCLMQLAVEGPRLGPILVDFAGHGLHEHDLPAVAAWAIGMVACAVAWRRIP